MSTPVTHPACTRTPVGTVRVSPREIRDVAFRAMRVAGASGGEASLAARAVVRAELRPGVQDGVAALLDELGGVRGPQDGARFTPGDVPTLDDPAGRGLFFAVLAGVEHLLAHPEVDAVVLPGQRRRPAAEAVVEVAAGARAGEVEIVDPPPGSPDGILLRRRPPGTRPEAPPRDSAADPDVTGVVLDSELWSAAQAAAAAYLVPDA